MLKFEIFSLSKYIISVFNYLEFFLKIILEYFKKGKIFLIIFFNCSVVKLEKEKNEGNSLYFNRLKNKIDEDFNWCYKDIVLI